MASPSPMSTTPAFSPGPQITRGPVTGNVFSQILEYLYEQCSLHITENIPSSVMFGVRPRIATARSNSSLLSPCSAARAAVTLLPSVIEDQCDLPHPPLAGGRGSGSGGSSRRALAACRVSRISSKRYSDARGAHPPRPVLSRCEGRKRELLKLRST